jgi:hypothetical protein
LSICEHGYVQSNRDMHEGTWWSEFAVVGESRYRFMHDLDGAVRANQNCVAPIQTFACNTRIAERVGLQEQLELLRSLILYVPVSKMDSWVKRS